MEDAIREEIEKRNLNIFHLIIASLLAKLYDMGILNRGVLNILAPAIAERIAIYLKHRYPELPKDPKEIIELTIREIDAFGKYEIREEEGKIFLIIDSSSCKYCPRGVGKAALKGVLCPFPYMFQRVLEILTGKKIEIVTKEGIVKRNNFCIAAFEIKE